MSPPKPAPPPTPSEPVAPEQVAPASVDPGHGIVIDFDPDELGIYIGVELEGPGGQRKQLDYLFDSGASFLTITRETAQQLGIAIPSAGPTVEFHTAAGMRSTPVVHVPGLRIGDVDVPGLSASICDPCATERGAGLLGLNVIREFVVQTDYQTSQMKLLPRVHESRINRAYDIQAMLDIAIEGQAQIRDDEIDWVIALRNEGPIAIEGVIPQVSFANGKQLRGQPVTRIEPGASSQSPVTGKVLDEGEDGSGVSYTLGLAEAYW